MLKPISLSTERLTVSFLYKRWKVGLVRINLTKIIFTPCELATLFLVKPMLVTLQAKWVKILWLWTHGTPIKKRGFLLVSVGVVSAGKTNYFQQQRLLGAGGLKIFTWRLAVRQWLLKLFSKHPWLELDLVNWSLSQPQNRQLVNDLLKRFSKSKEACLVRIMMMFSLQFVSRLLLTNNWSPLWLIFQRKKD